MVENVESVEFVIDREGLAPARADGLGVDVPAALAKLKNVKQFTLGSYSWPYMTIRITPGGLESFIPKWPALESLTFKNVATHEIKSLDRLLKSATAFRSLTVDGTDESVTAPETMLADLPLTTRALKVNSVDLFEDGHWWGLFNPDYPLNFDEHALEMAKGLQSVVLTDLNTHNFLPAPIAGARVDRGKLDEFVAALTNVKTLTDGPCAISDLSSLAALKKLSTLELKIGNSVPRQPVQPDELVDLFTNSQSLVHANLPSAIKTGWEDADKARVEAAAQGKVELKWV